MNSERRAEALLALRWLRGDAFDVDSELAEMEASYQIEKATVSGWSDVIQPWALKPILTSIGLMVFTQLCGVNAAQFNAVDIFRTSGIAISGVICAVILNSSQVIYVLMFYQFRIFFILIYLTKFNIMKFIFLMQY